ncbi:MAG: pyrroline-5-carboxylate reductase [Treponema sp.]|nr:pyrroline-5-carboxylate reductase [Treponema sp.]
MKIGFIGMGNMAQAIAAGFVNSKKIAASDLFAYAPNQEKLKANAQKIGFVPLASNKEVAQKSDAVFVCCKPYQIEGVLAEVGAALDGKALVSVAAGWTFDSYAKFLDTNKTRVLCVMPNTPARIGQGVILLEEKNSLNDDEAKQIKDLLGSLGLLETIPASLMGIGGALSGCGPAFMDMIIEAYADAAVKYGMGRAQAYRLASQMMLGSAALQLATGEHPGALKDAVCSPGGTTIRGVAALEKAGLRTACIQSIDTIMEFKNSKK